MVEIGASEDPADGGHAGGARSSSYLQTVTDQAMRALKLVMDRPENLGTKQYKSVLHFVCNSRFVAGKGEGILTLYSYFICTLTFSSLLFYLLCIKPYFAKLRTKFVIL